MHGAALHARRIKQSRGTFAHDAGTESGDALGPGEMGDQSGFGQALKIDCQIVMFRAQFIFCAPPGERVVAAEDNDAIDEAVAFEQRNPPRLNHPGDPRIGKTVLERRGSGQGVNDIAHRTESDDEDAFHLYWQLTSLTGSGALSFVHVTAPNGPHLQNATGEKPASESSSSSSRLVNLSGTSREAGPGAKNRAAKS